MEAAGRAHRACAYLIAGRIGVQHKPVVTGPCPSVPRPGFQGRSGMHRRPIFEVKRTRVTKGSGRTLCSFIGEESEE